MNRSAFAVAALCCLSGCDAGVRGLWRQLDATATVPPLEGVEVCIRGTATCDTTDAKGTFDLSQAALKLGDPYALSAKKGGFVPVNYFRVRHGRDSQFDFSIAVDAYYPPT